MKPICLALAIVAPLASCADLHGPPPAGQSATGAVQAGNAGGDGRMLPNGDAGSGGTLGSSAGAGASAGGSTSASAGGSSNSAGGSSAAGSASMAGSSPVGGSSWAGTSSGGSASSGGNSGTGNQGGTGGTGAPGGHWGGTAGTDGSGGCNGPVEGDLKAWVCPEYTDSKINEIHPFVALTTKGPEVTLSELSIRYYFTAEMTGDWQTKCAFVRGQTGDLCSITKHQIVAMESPIKDVADHYLEISFGDTDEVLSAASTLPFEARILFWRDGHPFQIQDNDYSFVPTTNDVLKIEMFDYRQTTKVTVYDKGVLIWGQEPCP